MKEGCFGLGGVHPRVNLWECIAETEKTGHWNVVDSVGVIDIIIIAISAVCDATIEFWTVVLHVVNCMAKCMIWQRNVGPVLSE